MTYDLKFSKEHEWVKKEGDSAIIGISSHATEELGEIVYVDLPKPGTVLTTTEEFGSVESVKTVSSLFAPISGVVTEINDAVVQNPALIWNDPQDTGWLIKCKPTHEQEWENLMTQEEYLTSLDKK